MVVFISAKKPDENCKRKTLQIFAVTHNCKKKQSHRCSQHTIYQRFVEVGDEAIARSSACKGKKFFLAEKILPFRVSLR